VTQLFGASLTDNYRSVIYDCNMFIIQATSGAIQVGFESIKLRRTILASGLQLTCTVFVLQYFNCSIVKKVLITKLQHLINLSLVLGSILFHPRIQSRVGTKNWHFNKLVRSFVPFNKKSSHLTSLLLKALKAYSKSNTNNLFQPWPSLVTRTTS
jgi:hypothetical protein